MGGPGSGRPTDRRRRRMVVLLRRRGHTLETIGKQLGVSRQAVHDLLKHAGYRRDPARDGRLRKRHLPKRHVKPLVTVEQILSWADAHMAKHRRWPNVRSGPIEGAAGETWRRIDGALRQGDRGLSGGSSLSRLLPERRGARPHATGRLLIESLILRWAKRHRRRKGEWPRWYSGKIPGVAGETWNAVNRALGRGGRGLPGGESLEKLLRRHGHIEYINPNATGRPGAPPDAPGLRARPVPG
jgi:Homeodomain-like domain